MIEVTQEHIQLIERLISKYFNIRQDNQLYHDLISVGMESILKCRNIYDPLYGTKFSSLLYRVALRDIIDFLGSSYSREFFIDKECMGEGQLSLEDLHDTTHVDVISTIIGESHLETALRYLSTCSELEREILYTYLNGFNYRSVCHRFSISKDKYYRTVDKLLDKVREQCLIDQKV